jgi:hypothetical protein
LDPLHRAELLLLVLSSLLRRGRGGHLHCRSGLMRRSRGKRIGTHAIERGEVVSLVPHILVPFVVVGEMGRQSVSLLPRRARGGEGAPMPAARGDAGDRGGRSHCEG